MPKLKLGETAAKFEMFRKGSGRSQPRLQAYIDDSISPMKGRRLFLAAYVNTAERWAEFSDAWDEVLHAEPAINYFKMSEAHGRGKQFRHFSEGQRNRKLFELGRVIQRSAPWAMHSSVSITDFDRLVRPHSPYPMQTPYFELFFAILIGVAQAHSALGLQMPCDFIFDQHEGLPGKVLPAFEAMMQVPSPELRKLVGSTPIFRDDREYLPLQAADMLAWHVRRAADGTYPKDYVGLMDMLSPPNRHYHTEIAEEQLAHIGGGMAEIAGASEIGQSLWRRMIEDFGGSLPASPVGITVALQQRQPHASTATQARELRWGSAVLQGQYPVQSPRLDSVSRTEAKLIRPDRSWSESSPEK